MLKLRKLAKIFLGFLLFAGTAHGAAFQFGGLRLDAVKVTSSGSATVLTSADKQMRVTTGSAADTQKLPDATTLQAGYWYWFNNESTAALTVSNSSSTQLTTLNQGESALLLVTSTSTSGGPWSVYKAVGSSSATVNPGLYSGTMVGVGGGWTNNTNTSYVDISAATTSNTLTQIVANTVACTAKADKTPAIDCTSLVTSGIYYVCATGTGGSNNNGAAMIRLVDGSGTIINGGLEVNTNLTSGQVAFSACGLYSSPGTSETFKLQGAATSGNAYILQDTQRPITWTVTQVK